MPSTTTKPRILVIEDEFIIVSVATELLTELGFEVVAALGTLQKALEIVDDVECDAAVLDIVLHNEDSFPLAEALARRGIPFGFATAWDKLALDEKWRAFPSISKPYALKDMRDLMGRVLPDYVMVPEESAAIPMDQERPAL